jgi:hypothetical protein
MDERSESARRRIVEVVYRIMMSGATVNSALDLPDVFPDFKKHVFESHVSGRSVAVDLLSQMTEGGLKEEMLTGIAKGLAEQAATNAETVVSAAVIVLAHSAVDDAFTAACEVAIDLDETSWRGELNRTRKVDLGEVIDLGMDGLLVRELEQFKKKLGAKSLPSRAELLFRHVPIRKHKEVGPEENAYYRGSKMEEADKLRHEIVHGSRLPPLSIEKSKSMSSFLFEAAYTAFRSIAFKFNLPFDMEHFQEVAGVKKPEG